MKKVKTIKIKFAQNNENIWAYFVTHIKMIVITKQTCENNFTEVIVDDNGILWLNKKHMEENLNHKYLPALYQTIESIDVNQQMNQKANQT